MSLNIILALNLSEKKSEIPAAWLFWSGLWEIMTVQHFPQKNLTKQNQTRCLLIRSLVVLLFLSNFNLELNQE